MSKQFIGAIDQGTTSTRFMIFDHAGREVARQQLEHAQILPRAGWVEHDPSEILARTEACIRGALGRANLTAGNLAGVGVTNQRETTVVWNRATGQPYYNAIVWQDTRNAAAVRALEQSNDGAIIKQKTGLPPATYFSAGKLEWLLDNVAGLRVAAERGDALFGNIDTWLIWNLTGGAHITDVTNASRTQLMNLVTGDWDEELLTIFNIPRRMLPAIRPSSDKDFYGMTRADSAFGGSLPLCADLGDQQAALVGQVCFRTGEAKNTYGTGSFLLLSTGAEIVPSPSGLLTTAGYKFRADEPTTFALEGSIAVTGSAVQWLRDQLGIIQGASEIETLANTVKDNGGVYFVPAFSGLFAPYWRADARGAIVGLSRYNDRGHLARATLEAICYQTRDVLEAMTTDAGVKLEVLKVDGGATANATLMQLQADILGVPVSRPMVAETTALGAAYAAGLAVGFWQTKDELRANWLEGKRWMPHTNTDEREAGYAQWRKAVTRTLNWLELE